MNTRFSWFNATSIALGFAFLYIPILLLIVYSFNESKLVTVWGGWSTKWYAGLLKNDALMDAAWVTVRVALISATIATILGTLAAIVLTRMSKFRGRTLFSGLVFAPLVMPEVITGLSLLLLFVALGFDRGFWTVTIAHSTFAMCFAAVVVQSRLLDFDKSVEEAAMDLGATPVRTFFEVTLPIIAPAVISAWLLAFTLSLDDLVIASFTSGPGATTLADQDLQPGALGRYARNQCHLNNHDRVCDSGSLDRVLRDETFVDDEGSRGARSQQGCCLRRGNGRRARQILLRRDGQ